ncbi:MAG: type II secretion system protein N, partial [Thiolinea sp.]
MQKLKQQQLFDRVFDRLPDHVTLLLIIVSGFLLARLTWMMFPSDPSLIAEIPVEQESQGVSVIKAHAKSADLGKEIAGYHLLGVYKPPAPVKKAVTPKPVKVVEAPKAEPKKPRPPLNLVGVYALSGKSGIAIINAQGKQQVVGLNEAIGDSGAKLTKVMAESVEISWDGDIQTLQMPNIGKTALSAIQLPASQQPQAQPAVQQPLVQPAAALPIQNQQNSTTQQQENKVNAGTSAGGQPKAPADPALGV